MLRTVFVVSLLFTSIHLSAQSSASAAAGQMPPGQEIKCQKADGSPCGDPEVSDLNKDISDAKTTYGDSQSTVGDAQTNVSDVKQVGSDAQQVGSDLKKPLANPKQTVTDVKQAAGDVKSAVGDAQQSKSDAQQAGQDVKQGLSDVKKTFKDLAGIKSLTLEALDGSMKCAQNDGSACNDAQTKALQTKAAQKAPPLTVTGEVDQASN
jgi:methyl-accepting chemotaxis protein